MLAPVLFAAACGTPIATNNNDAAVSPLPDLTTVSTTDLNNTTTMGLSIGPIDLPAGTETTQCVRYRLTNTVAIDVTKITATLAPGSHHLVFYKSADTTEQKDLYKCSPLDVSTGDVPYYIAETEENNTLTLPTGAAYHIEAGQMVRLEAHYLNATTKPVSGMGNITLQVGAPAVYEKADIMFCGSVSQLYQGLGAGVPPGMTTLQPDYYKPPAGIKVFGLTTHQHKRGTLMELSKSTSKADPGTNLTMGTPYDNPPFKIYGDNELVTFTGTEGFRWQCNYNNTTSNTYYFGQSAEDNEMCFFWAYYYPSVGRFLEKTDCWR